ncbi:MAG TPA: C40 family peptidase [Lacipirellulaceae bacterium]|nr:C40 family peptidase [Lacipirellulaceae bacterium]
MSCDGRFGRISMRMIAISMAAWALSAVVARAAETAATAEPVMPPDMRRVARKIEPDLKGDPARLAQYVNFFSRELGNDSRMCAFDVTCEPRGKKVVLHGFVEFPETRKSLIEFLSALGFEIENQMESLPADDLGTEIFGITKVTHSYCFDRPTGKRKQETDCLLGEPVFLLREHDGQLLVHSHEGYLGYVPSKDIVRMDEDRFSKYLDGPRVLVAADQKSSKPAIPAGARLKWVSTDGDQVAVELPTGDKVKIAAADCHVNEAPAAKIDEIIETAKKLLGTPYFWGGRTSEGIDCSGLVQQSYASVGLFLPRDAYQQFYVGQLSATRWHMAGLRRGDMLYFLASDGKIRHTAIYLGNDKFIQAVMPHAKISSFNPKDPEYDAVHKASFAFAKRLLD